MENQENILEIKGLSKRFGQTEALRNVNLNIPRGSITGILGPNGAGKTTLLRIINGILAKDEGSVLVGGEETDLKIARKIGYMPEERGLYDNMTVEDQIVYFGRLKGGDPARIREVMHEYLTLFNLDGDIHRKVKEFSKGNQQKIQIIATLVHEPELIILDEPFSGFDPINGKLLSELIERLQKKGTTVILSSHNMPAVEEMCDEIALINHGEILLSGRLDDIKEANKTHRMHITVNSPLNLQLIESSGLIKNIEQVAPANGRKGSSYMITKADGTTNLQLFNEISMQSNISQFEEALPTLNEIFIKYTTN